MKFEDELKEFYENRSKYRFIKPDVVAQDWCVYIFGKKKEFYKSLGIAKAVSYTHLTLPTIYSV